MLPFAHFALGSFIGYFLSYKTNKKLLFTLLGGFIALSPDFDLVFGVWKYHRLWSHSLPFWILAGLLTLWFFKNFWLGFLPYMSHYVLDFFSGTKLYVMPYMFTEYNIWKTWTYDNMLIADSAFATLLVLIIIIVEWRRT